MALPGAPGAATASEGGEAASEPTLRLLAAVPGMALHSANKFAKEETFIFTVCPSLSLDSLVLQVILRNKENQKII